MALSDRFPPGPWFFTGALENRPDIVRAISATRPLWGCSPEAIAKVRAPGALHGLLLAHGLKCPPVLRAGDRLPTNQKWLIKPLAGAAGFGIRKAPDSPMREIPDGCYGQGICGRAEACSGLFIGHERGCLFLGATAQLIGTSWLHAEEFHYAGSIGPLDLSVVSERWFCEIGQFLAEGCGLRGIFGVDCVLHNDVPWVIEINPLYTASVEVWEYANGRSALALHRGVFENQRELENSSSPMRAQVSARAKNMVGKAILFARETAIIPASTPWSGLAMQTPQVFDLPGFADLPNAGERIEKGHPILTFFAVGPSAEACTRELEQRARALDRWLYNN